MVWDASEGVEIMVLATYNEALNDQATLLLWLFCSSWFNIYANWSIRAVTYYAFRWSNFSTFMSPENTDMGVFLSPIISDVIIAKDNAGLAYLPEWNFNGIGDLQVGQRLSS